MIRQITNEGIGFSGKIFDSTYGRRFRALHSAYGTGYDFCRFYEIIQENGQAFAVVFNSAMTLCATGSVDMEEIHLFMEMNQIFSVEMPRLLGESFQPFGYNKVLRILFGFASGEYPMNMHVNEVPPLDEVFTILKTGFPLENAYALWLTDVSHQIRHGASRIYLYNNTTATQYYCMDNVAFFGQIATLPEDRGKGHARELLYWLFARMAEEGIQAQLYAKPERVSFYKGIGFKEVDRDFIFEREQTE